MCCRRRSISTIGIANASVLPEPVHASTVWLLPLLKVVSLLSANARSASALCLPMTAYLARFAALGGGPSTRFLLVDGLPLCRFCEISLSAFFGLPAPLGVLERVLSTFVL